jgi:predicted RNase H-like nuclease
LGKQKKLAGKKTELGRSERITLLKDSGFTKIEKWLNHRFGTGIGRDDLIDACACAIAAREAKDRLPKNGGDADTKGLRMEIWY